MVYHLKLLRENIGIYSIHICIYVYVFNRSVVTSRGKSVEYSELLVKLSLASRSNPMRFNFQNNVSSETELNVLKADKQK